MSHYKPVYLSTDLAENASFHTEGGFKLSSLLLVASTLTHGIGGGKILGSNLSLDQELKLRHIQNVSKRTLQGPGERSLDIKARLRDSPNTTNVCN